MCRVRIGRVRISFAKKTGGGGLANQNPAHLHIVILANQNPAHLHIVILHTIMSLRSWPKPIKIQLICIKNLKGGGLKKKPGGFEKTGGGGGY